MTRDELQTRLARLIAELTPGGSQERCESLRSQIEATRRLLEHAYDKHTDEDDR